MAKLLWQDLKKLVTIDQQLSSFDSTRESIENKISHEKSAIDQLEKLLADLKETSRQKQKEVDSIELEAKTLDAKEKEKQDKLATSSDMKAISGFRKELDVLALRRQDLENALISSWHQLELAKKKDEKAQEQHPTLVEKHAEEIARLENELSKLKEQKTQSLTDEKKLLEEIPKEWLDKYKRMKGRVKNPIVPLNEDTCSACYYLVLRQDLERIRKNAILPCRNCYRFLYFDAGEKAKADETAY